MVIFLILDTWADILPRLLWQSSWSPFYIIQRIWIPMKLKLHPRDFCWRSNSSERSLQISSLMMSYVVLQNSYSCNRIFQRFRRIVKRSTSSCPAWVKIFAFKAHLPNIGQCVPIFSVFFNECFFYSLIAKDC